MTLVLRFKMSQRVSFAIVIMLTLFYGHLARADHSFAYICSDNNVYSVRVRSAQADGYTSRGAWFKFESFCRANVKSAAACRDDNARPTLRCFQEFREKGNLGSVRGVLALWPSKIRHSPTVAWFDQIRIPENIGQLCQPAIRGWDCDRQAKSSSGQFKCLYDKSGPNNRAYGRNCYTALNTRLSEAAQEHRRRLRATTRQVAGR